MYPSILNVSNNYKKKYGNTVEFPKLFSCVASMLNLFNIIDLMIINYRYGKINIASGNWIKYVNVYYIKIIKT